MSPTTVLANRATLSFLYPLEAGSIRTTRASSVFFVHRYDVAFGGQRNVLTWRRCHDLPALYRFKSLFARSEQQVRNTTLVLHPHFKDRHPSLRRAG